MADPDKLSRLNFAAASEIWLQTRKPYLRSRSFEGYRSSKKQLDQFFGSMIVSKIHLGNVREYQRARLTNAGGLWRSPAAASIIEHDITIVLKGVLERAGVWKHIGPHMETLPLPQRKTPKVMTDEEEMRLFAIASTNPDWKLAYWVASLTTNSGAAGSELRNIRLGDIFLDARKPCFRVDIETAKNEFRGRMVPLNQTAAKQLARCVERAKLLGSFLPSHYLFPHRITNGKWDPERPTSHSWLRRSFTAMKMAADIPWLTPHCLRHQHITISLECGEAPYTVAKRVGHGDTKMIEKVYSHLRMDSQKAAVDAIDPSVRFGPKRAEMSTQIRRIK